MCYRLWRLQIIICVRIRQKPIDNYILDFYCPEKKIEIEIDGSQHYTEEGKEYDRIRTDILNTYKIENKCKNPQSTSWTAPLLKGLFCNAL